MTTDGPPGVVVEPMRRRHLRQVLRIEAQRGEPGWSLGLFMAELGRPEGRIYLVARDTANGRVLGFVGALVAVDDLHVTTVAVDPTARRRGVATRLLVELVRRGVAAGTANATLEVRADNEPALALYRRFGFAPVGTRAGYYREPDGSTTDALVLWATDIAGVAYAERLATLSGSVPGEPAGPADPPRRAT